jgi:carboxylesterase
MRIENPYIIPQAEPFYFHGDDTACLLIHGFTGTPMEMRPLGEYLSKQGYSVLGIRLAGHATQISDMMRMRWWDWLASVEDGINLLTNNNSQIVTIGLSMGGILSLIAASRYTVIGSVSLSAPYSLGKDWRLKLLPLLKWFLPEVRKSYAKNNGESTIDHIDYHSYPTQSIMELMALQEEMRRCLPKIKVPVLLMHSKLDKTAPPTSMPTIFNQLTIKDKEMHWVENSGHVITLGTDQEIVFRRVHDFIKKLKKNRTRNNI